MMLMPPPPSLQQQQQAVCLEIPPRPDVSHNSTLSLSVSDSKPFKIYIKRTKIILIIQHKTTCLQPRYINFFDSCKFLKILITTFNILSTSHNYSTLLTNLLCIIFRFLKSYKKCINLGSLL